MVLGIDYGSKLAGTTAIAYIKDGKIFIEQSAKKKDADAFIEAICTKLNPDLLAIDAPLSLPKVFSQGDGSDYFYRACDKTLKAMSPMFIGGLTARAIQLKDRIKVPCVEVYPKATRLAFLPTLENYKKAVPNPKHVDALEQLFEKPILSNITTWHQFDACLALFSGLRYLSRIATQYGDREEGLIWV